MLKKNFNALVGMLIIGAFAMIIYSAATAPQKSPAEQAKSEAENIDPKKAKEEYEYQHFSGALRQLVAAMKNPASFELVSAVKMSSGELCIEYRGTNGFNAIVTEFAIFKKDFSISSRKKDWAKYCAGKSGERYTHIRYNL